MNVKDIYLKTMKFVWLKMGVGAIITVISLILLAIVAGIGLLFDNATIFIFLILIWICATGGIYRLVMNYVGYMVKAAHIAVISTAVTTGQIPDNMFEAGKNMVVSRFGTTNVYFILDKLVSGAVNQLQKAVGRIGGLFDSIPGVSNIVSVLQLFIKIALGYIDECCLGWTFVNTNQGAFKSGCDGVAIYFQNAKHLLKNAAITTFVVILGTLLCWLVPFAIVGLIFSALDWNMVIAALIALVIALVLKAAFIDSYMMVKMMVSYMQVAPSTVITFDIYDKLCKLSSKFRELFGKAQQEAAPTYQYQQPGY